MTGDDEAEAKHVHCQGRENQNRFLEVGPPDQFSTARSPVSLSVSPAPLDTIDARSPLLSASSAVHLSRRPVPCIHCKIIRRRCDLVKPHCGRCIERGLECSWTSQTLEPLDRPPKLSPKPSLLEPPNVMSIASLIDDSDIPSIPVVTVSFGETMNQDNLSMNSCTGCRTLKRKCSRMIPECGQCKSRGVPSISAVATTAPTRSIQSHQLYQNLKILNLVEVVATKRNDVMENDHLVGIVCDGMLSVNMWPQDQELIFGGSRENLLYARLWSCIVLVVKRVSKVLEAFRCTFLFFLLRNINQELLVSSDTI
ncbi:hypothetical protein BCR33DRAFT_318267 [Rhizoclosmatium globosum]|uniref:Zn(2)-C6 fungal-type domain-containing protein n=1 Tax=Rhizoclosmatium globosum TaxID=329046 RepID=A0A1Y2CZS5_9FUNG|nr:hypothetical protein BCR33DRAFT_318267 [Rhizoclosmatium globosum]|eukprot:ORY52457.1 hypothetical protein BCR33DRAFT_318267 [Rhizoclosmatium globosum]